MSDVGTRKPPNPSTTQQRGDVDRALIHRRLGADIRHEQSADLHPLPRPDRDGALDRRVLRHRALVRARLSVSRCARALSE
jgi:hypothetical protein